MNTIRYIIIFNDHPRVTPGLRPSQDNPCLGHGLAKAERQGEGIGVHSDRTGGGGPEAPHIVSKGSRAEKFIS